MAARPRRVPGGTSIAFAERLDDEGIRRSIGSVVDAYDNALVETVIGLYKTECIRTTVFHDGTYKTHADVEYATAGWVDRYNNRRLRGTVAMQTPVEYESAYYAAPTASRSPYESGREPGALHPTATFTQAHDQLNDWRAWVARAGNAAPFRERFMISGETFDHRPLQPKYVLVYGRQCEFRPGDPQHADPEALLAKRDLQARAHESFLTYDSLRPRYDHSDSLSVAMRATGPQAIAFSPVYRAGDGSGAMAMRVRDTASALRRSALMTPERRAYLVARPSHWRQVEEGCRGEPRGGTSAIPHAGVSA